MKLPILTAVIQSDPQKGPLLAEVGVVLYVQPEVANILTELAYGKLSRHSHRF